ncbi:MAG TPA: tRNA-dihydrouridine synthase family protein [Candidatus Thermoplasmatota archaeon]|nr:tRNA-dihydrouridine synthase family protein [Candidatus Thermoplasmatota archaeon]
MAELLHPLTIGNVTIPNNLVLSPMAGFSDLPFRVLCRKHGAGLVSSEMVAAGGVGREAPHPTQRMRVSDLEHPTSIQLFGTDPVEVENAARAVEANCEILGFNMGCPAPQIKRQGCGAALLDHPERCEELVRAVKRGSNKPLLVKMRAGNGGLIDFLALGKRLESAGADAFIFHARTAAQGYSGKADWHYIRRLKEHISVPVIGNGDIRTGRDARNAIEVSGADGVALGRATLGDPRVFSRIAHFLQHGIEPPVPTPQERAADYLEYLDMADGLGFHNVRLIQQAQRFTNGLEGGKELREALRGHVPIRVVREGFERLRDTGSARAAAQALPPSRGAQAALAGTDSVAAP